MPDDQGRPTYRRPEPGEPVPFCFSMGFDAAAMRMCWKADDEAGEGKEPGKEMFMNSVQRVFRQQQQDMWNQRVKPWAEEQYGKRK